MNRIVINMKLRKKPQNDPCNENIEDIISSFKSKSSESYENMDKTIKKIDFYLENKYIPKEKEVELRQYRQRIQKSQEEVLNDISNFNRIESAFKTMCKKK